MLKYKAVSAPIHIGGKFFFGRAKFRYAIRPQSTAAVCTHTAFTLFPSLLSLYMYAEQMSQRLKEQVDVADTKYTESLDMELFWLTCITINAEFIDKKPFIAVKSEQSYSKSLAGILLSWRM